MTQISKTMSIDELSKINYESIEQKRRSTPFLLLTSNTIEVPALTSMGWLVEYG